MRARLYLRSGSAAEALSPLFFTGRPLYFLPEHVLDLQTDRRAASDHSKPTSTMDAIVPPLHWRSWASAAEPRLNRRDRSSAPSWPLLLTARTRPSESSGGARTVATPSHCVEDALCCASVDDLRYPFPSIPLLTLLSPRPSFVRPNRARSRQHGFPGRSGAARRSRCGTEDRMLQTSMLTIGRNRDSHRDNLQVGQRPDRRPLPPPSLHVRGPGHCQGRVGRAQDAHAQRTRAARIGPDLCRRSSEHRPRPRPSHRAIQVCPGEQRPSTMPCHG